MKKNRIVTLICCMIFGISVAATGCGNNTTASDESQSDKQSEEGKDTVFGQITSVDGEKITIALAEEPKRPDGSAGMGEAPKRPDGSTEMGEPPELPEGSTEMGEPSELPEGSTEQGEAPKGPDGSTELGEAPDESDTGTMKLNLTGEEKTVTIDSNTKIVVNQRGQDSSEGIVSDLTENTIVTVTMDGDKVEKISVGGGMFDKNMPVNKTTKE